MPTQATVRITPSLGISVTPTCQLSCVYCPPHGENIVACERLCAVGPILGLLEAFAEAGGRVVRLTGGEPLLEPTRTRELLVHAVQLAFPKIILNTNGVCLRKELSWLRDLGRRFECKVSLDTLVPSEYERLTGRNLCAEVMRGVQTAIEGGLCVTINIMYTRHNASSVLDVLHFCEELGCDAKIFDVYDFGGVFPERWEDSYANLDPFLHLLEKKYQKSDPERLPGGRGIEMTSFKIGESNRLLVVNHHGARRGTRLFAPSCMSCGRYPCGGGRFHLALRSDGLLCPCRLRPDLGLSIEDCEPQKVASVLAKQLADFYSCWYG